MKTSKDMNGNGTCHTKRQSQGSVHTIVCYCTDTILMVRIQKEEIIKNFMGLNTKAQKDLISCTLFKNTTSDDGSFTLQWIDDNIFMTLSKLIGHRVERATRCCKNFSALKAKRREPVAWSLLYKHVVVKLIFPKTQA